MPQMPTDLTPAEAWNPLPADRFDASAARHLLRRIGFAALPDEAERAAKDGLEATVHRLLGEPWSEFPLPQRCTDLVEGTPEAERLIAAAADVEAREKIRRDLRDKTRQAFDDLSVTWLRRAATTEHSAREKWVLFLFNILVVSREKINDPRLFHAHFELLRRLGRGPYPDLLKAVSRSPAMVRYLDLDQNRKERPNENFARELFELFSLGEGNYTEADIKEASRAFTGYRQRRGTFYEDKKAVDKTTKTIFGRSGAFSGDDVVDLVFQQEAATRFIPGELCRFYLAEETLPKEYLDALGFIYKGNGWHLGKLAERFFTSRLFFHPAFRGNMIKSPIQFYVGLTQDLGIHVPPFPRPLSSLRQMGQRVFEPPNVRGWVGGRLWMNASTFAARRAVVEQCFNEVDEAKLNADDLAALTAAREKGEVQLFVSKERLGRMVASTADAIANRFTTFFLPGEPSPGFTAALRDHLAAAKKPEEKIARVRAAATALLQTPEYQLC